MAKSLNEWELQALLWVHFDWRRTREMGGNVRPLAEGFLSLAVRPDTSHREAIEEIARASNPPFSIAYLSERLDETKLIRGRTYFGRTGRTIDTTVENYPGMRWWLEKGGLVIDTVAPDESQLSEFDRKAGKLVCDGTQNRKLSPDVVRQIAANLDAAGFVLSDNLQPAQWQPIANHNQKFAKKAIKTFAAAVSHPRLAYYIRRRLYVARDRYQKVHKDFHR